MLDFIVLGEIPGTNLRLGFFVILSLYILVGLTIVWFVDKTLLLKLVPAKLHKNFSRKKTAK